MSAAENKSAYCVRVICHGSGGTVSTLLVVTYFIRSVHRSCRHETRFENTTQTMNHARPKRDEIVKQFKYEKINEIAPYKRNDVV